MNLQIPVFFFELTNFTTVENWFEDKIKNLEKNCTPGHLYFLKYDENNQLIETVVDINLFFQSEQYKSILAHFVPQQLKKEKAFACLSCCEAWLKDPISEERLKEVVLINCETLYKGNIYVYDTNKTDKDFTLINKKDFGEQTIGRFSRFLEKHQNEGN